MHKYLLLLLLMILFCGCAASNGNLLQKGPAAPSFSVADHQGQIQSLEALIQKGPVVLTFLRSFY